MADESHVIKRDGKGYSGGPRPTPPQTKIARGEQDPDPAVFGGEYSKAGTDGVFPVDKATFDKIGTGRSPRHEFPEQPGETAGEPPRTMPAPID